IKWFKLKCGSKATPKSPRSPVEYTERVTKGAASKTPFLITLNAPVCEQTNIRPSSANAIAVGAEIPVTTVVSTKPEGSVAAEAEKDKPNNRNTIAMNDRPWCIPGSRRKEEMIARACFRRVRRITPGKPGRPRASTWERDSICGRPGWLGKPFISLTHQGDENSSVGCTQSIGIALQRSVGQMMRRGPFPRVPAITWISRPVMILLQTRQ